MSTRRMRKVAEKMSILGEMADDANKVMDAAVNIKTGGAKGAAEDIISGKKTEVKKYDDGDKPIIQPDMNSFIVGKAAAGLEEQKPDEDEDDSFEKRGLMENPIGKRKYRGNKDNYSDFRKKGLI